METQLVYLMVRMEHASVLRSAVCRPHIYIHIHTAIIGSCDLSSSDAEEVLKRHIQSKRVRGIRQMLNFHPDKPQYSETKHDNYLTDPNWIRSFALLEKYQLSFDLQILPRQMQRLGIKCQ